MDICGNYHLPLKGVQILKYIFCGLVGRVCSQAVCSVFHLH